MTIAKEYLPAEVERRWIQRWEEAQIFRADPESDKPPFCIVIPPPNVTGNLHIGHVLVYTLHDIVSRWRRMAGDDVLWLPGTDHAGIATQMVVERQLKSEGIDRRDLGREAFEERVWEWKDKYGTRITDALRNLGSSCDWSRERFTLDDGLSRAVRKVFVQLYNEGLIYRDRYIVNWCPGCQTAISDLETNHLPQTGALYRILYRFADGREGGVEVATTRPETLLGDTAIAVHPEDERYSTLVGAEVVVPLVDRKIKVVADDFVDPEFGTGAVKLTPGHDPNDFAAGQRLGLETILVIDPTGKMTAAAGERYQGTDRFEARKQVIADLSENGQLLSQEPHENSVGRCQRCQSIIEPLVSRQWFVKVEQLANAAIDAVESGRTEFVPATWSKVYFEWMRNIHDWCISRQLWWGHRIPAWHCDSCDTMVVADEEPRQCASCNGDLRQEEDVLDTWFSSALWPFSTMGWPDETADLARYYPTQLLITGHDIIFFWVARMMMMGLKFQGEVPFGQVYIHGLVRDAQGQKMSKTKGNTVDPAEVQERYGTDAVRFTMAILAAPGNDIPLAPERMEGYRAFANKLWNATRFVEMKLGDGAILPYQPDELSLPDRWVLSRTSQTIRAVDEALANYRFDRAADALYHFVWHEFCDWYIEWVKPDFFEGAADRRGEVARAVLSDVLEALLRLLHPMMPFITEELWDRLERPSGFIAVAPWPRADEFALDSETEETMALLQKAVVQIRHLRAESRIDAGKRIAVQLSAQDRALSATLQAQRERVATLVRASDVEIVDTIDPKMIAARGVVEGIEIALPLADLLDLDAERARIRKDLDKLQKEFDGRQKKLANEAFVAKAPAAVVEKERQAQVELTERKGRLEANLVALGEG